MLKHYLFVLLSALVLWLAPIHFSAASAEVEEIAEPNEITEEIEVTEEPVQPETVVSEEPVVSEPETVEEPTEVTEPEVSEPETPVVTVEEPTEVTEPEVSEPETPVVTVEEPTEVTEPEVSEPETPVITVEEPTEVTEPEVSEPETPVVTVEEPTEVTEPEVTKPETPVVTVEEPTEVTEPEVTKPETPVETVEKPTEVTEPEVTKPETPVETVEKPTEVTEPETPTETVEVECSGTTSSSNRNCQTSPQVSTSTDCQKQQSQKPNTASSDDSGCQKQQQSEQQQKTEVADTDESDCQCSPYESNTENQSHAVIAKLNRVALDQYNKQLGLMFSAEGLHEQQQVVSAQVLWKDWNTWTKAEQQQVQWFVDKSSQPKWFDQNYQPSDCNNLTTTSSNQYWTVGDDAGFDVTEQFREWYQAGAVNDEVVMVGRYQQQQYNSSEIFNRQLDQDEVELLLEVEEPAIPSLNELLDQLNGIPELQDSPLQQQDQQLVMQVEEVEFIMEPYQYQYNEDGYIGLELRDDYMRLATPSGVEVLARPTVHNMTGLRSALASLGQVEITQQAQWLHINLNQQNYRALPDFSSTPAYYTQAGLHVESASEVCFVYKDEQGQMRQQNFYVEQD